MKVDLPAFPGTLVSLTLDTDPPIQEWVTSPGRSGELEYMAGSYQLSLKRETPDESVVWSFTLRHRGGKNVRLHSYTLECVVPVLDLSRIWHASVRQTGAVNVHLPWFTEAQTVGFNGMPLVLCLSRGGSNRFGMGLANQLLESKMTGHFHNPTLGTYTVKITRPSTGIWLDRPEVSDAVWLTTRKTNWFETVRQYTAWVDQLNGYVPNPAPDWVTEATWDSWAAHMDDINEQVILENAKRAKELGFGIIFIDAGWYAPTGRWGSAPNLGDWEPDPSKFPRFRETIRKLQSELGLKVQLWISIFWMGRGSKAYPAMKDALMVPPDGADEPQAFIRGFADGADVAWREELAHGRRAYPELYLCPCHPKTKEYCASTVYRVVRDYGVDALYFDFMDATPMECKANHPHKWESIGEGYEDCLKAIYQAAKQANPEILVEFKQGYMNLNTKRYANGAQTQSGLHDLDAMRRLTVLQHSWSPGVVVRGGTVLWHSGEAPEIVGKYMATQVICGVPCLTNDLRALPEAHLRIVKQWLEFYRAHRDRLLSGRLVVLDATAELYQDLLRHCGEDCYLYISSSPTIRLPDIGSPRRIHIFNATYSDSIDVIALHLNPTAYEVESYDCYLRSTTTTSRVRHGEPAYFCLGVPSGGMARIDLKY